MYYPEILIGRFERSEKLPERQEGNSIDPLNTIEALEIPPILFGLKTASNALSS